MVETERPPAIPKMRGAGLRRPEGVLPQDLAPQPDVGQRRRLPQGVSRSPPAPSASAARLSAPPLSLARLCATTALRQQMVAIMHVYLYGGNVAAFRLSLLV